MARRATFIVILGVGAAAISYLGNELGPVVGAALGALFLFLLLLFGVGSADARRGE